MHVIRHALFVIPLMVAPACALAAPTDPTFAVDRPLTHLPTQREVGHALGLANFTLTWTERKHLVQAVRRACLRGAARVRIVSADPEGMKTDTLATAR